MAIKEEVSRSNQAQIRLAFLTVDLQLRHRYLRGMLRALTNQNPGGIPRAVLKEISGALKKDTQMEKEFLKKWDKKFGKNPIKPV